MRIGFGYDVHRLVEGRPLILGGVAVDHPRGLAGHSDADVVLHAVADAVFGALALGDIGQWFPPGDPRTKDLSSRHIVARAVAEMRRNGYRLGNVDVTVVAEAPKLSPYVPEMRRRLAALFEADEGRIGIKATTAERMGAIGREEGIAAYAVVLLVPDDPARAYALEGGRAD